MRSEPPAKGGEKASERSAGDDPTEERRSPLVSQVVLLVGFLLVLVASIFTVLVPELTSEDDEDEADTAAVDAASSPASAPGPSAPGGSAPGPSDPGAGVPTGAAPAAPPGAAAP